MKIELKNVQINKRWSRDSLCYTAGLHVNGKFVATAANAGNGGPDILHFIDAATERTFMAYVRGLPPKTYPDGLTLPMDAELFMGQLLDEHQNRKLCRTKTVFRLHSDKEHLQVVAERFSPSIKAWLQANYGANLAEIMNETLSV